MLQTLKNAWKILDLRKKILYTILLIVVFRFGSYVPVPWLDASVISQQLASAPGNTLFNLMDSFSGGALSQATIFAMSISPYINSSIIMQLLCVAIPALERMSKEGAEGRKKITKITRYLTVALAAIQALGLYLTLKSWNAVKEAGVPEALKMLTIIIAFTAGTAFLMWLGEQITGRGIGNGISMLIFAGIIARVPTMTMTVINSFNAWYQYVLLVVYMVASIAFVVLINDAERRIPVQYAKRVVGNRVYGGQSSNIPIKVSQGGVIPIIFAMSIMTFPATLAQLFSNNQGILKNISDFLTGTWFYPVLYFILIIAFTYFYTSITFNPVEIANNIKQSGGAIMGIRPGRPTSDYIKKVLSKITLIGSLALAVIAVLPIVVSFITGQQLSALALTGTSLLIVVGVALETVKQIEAQMVMRHYKGFLE